MPDDTHAVAIVGAGTIGIGWAVALGRGGLGVRLHDPDAAQLERALAESRRASATSPSSSCSTSRPRRSSRASRPTPRSATRSTASSTCRSARPSCSS